MTDTSSAARCDAAPAARHLDDALFVACGLAWACGLIHVQAAIDHVREYALSAVFFALLAPAQLAWGTAVYRHRRRREGLLRAGAAMSLMVAALWIVSRTSGLPIGPAAWRPEAVGPIDSIATMDEITLALLAFLHLRLAAGGAAARHSRHLAAAAGVVLILLSSIALVLAGHEH